MTKTYILKGLDCANCAAKIEAAVKRAEGVSEVSLNFISSTLRIEVAGGQADGITGVIERIVHSYEPDVAVEEGQVQSRPEGHTHGESGKSEIIRLAVGALGFFAALLADRVFGAEGITILLMYIGAYLILGYDVLLKAIKNIARGQVFDENFLMSLATLGAFAVGEHPEAAAVMLFYQTGEFFQGLAVRRSKRSIAELMDIRPDTANLKAGDKIERVSPESVRVGDIIVVRPGEKIPLDGVVVEGESMLDTSALTGEPAPRRAAVSDAALSGCVNLSGLLTIEVSKPYGESTVAKIIDLVENASSKKAPAENFITTFSRYYTPAVVALAAVIAFIPPLFAGGGWSDWINRGLIFLVISCPCALVISIPLGFFGGIGGASKRGILVKGGNYLEALNRLDIVVFDKTGTLTKGVFEVARIYPAEGFEEGGVLELAAKAEAFSIHPIALSILKAYGAEPDKEGLGEYNETPGHGVSVTEGGRRILAGNHKLMELMGIPFAEPSDTGTRVYVAVDGAFAGCVVISDQVKPDSRAAVAALRIKGVRRAVMLTGDNQQTADAIAGELGLDEAHGGLLPGQKVEMVEALGKTKRAKGKLAFVGDGINDAPVLAIADVGIAMGGLGSDAAIEAADVVLMTDEPSKLAEAVDIARFTKKIVRQNIVFALGVKGLFLLLGAFGIATLWEAVFADVGVALIAILNAARIIKRG